VSASTVLGSANGGAIGANVAGCGTRGDQLIAGLDAGRAWLSDAWTMMPVSRATGLLAHLEGA
jgi:hypothetical protein